METHFAEAGLPGAARSDQRHHLALTDLERDAPQYRLTLHGPIDTVRATLCSVALRFASLEFERARVPASLSLWRSAHSPFQCDRLLSRGVHGIAVIPEALHSTMMH